MKLPRISFKQIIPHLVAILVFVALSLIYMAPAAFEGKDLPQGDVSNAKASSQELIQFHKKTSEPIYWTNGMFSGMPANMIRPPKTDNIFRTLGKWVSLGLPDLHIRLVFLYLLGFYILMLAFGCNPWLSLVGAIAYSLCSYNLIIIEAGHVNKALVMATVAPLIGGIVLCYRRKWLIGSFVTLIAAGLNIYWGHQQISYYAVITIAVLAITYFVYAIRQKELKNFFLSSALLVVLAVLALLPAAGSLLPTMDYTKETMRGGAVLQQNKTENNGPSAGLDIDYAYSWSYGVGETMTLLIPNLYGGSSHYNIGNESACYQALRTTGQAKQFCEAAPTYWGDQPFTSGPVYAGAIVCFLFVLGLFLVKGPERGWLLIATIISILLSWGRHFMGLNEWLFYHLPLYNKFRTPSMSLIIADITMATMAILAIKALIECEDKNAIRRPIWISFGITGGLCLLFALFGGAMFHFSGINDSYYPEWLVEQLKVDRIHLLRADAWRSFLFIALSLVCLMVYIGKSAKTNPSIAYNKNSYSLIAALGVLILIDLWSVDKRFLNNDDFLPKKQAKAFVASAADQQILKDTDPDYRVLNLTVNTFNDSSTSYFHKSVGGYSAAKLRRYQDIIDYHLNFQNQPTMSVLNMLNTRYFIVPGQNSEPTVQYNPNALGNAWFVDNIIWVDSPDEEINALYLLDPAKTACIDKVWKEKLPNSEQLTAKVEEEGSDASSGPMEPAAWIRLKDYVHPGNLIYESHNSQAQLAVFSEVFYKTWKAYIDGVETPIVRANYILRALPIPAGEHQIEFKCIDEVYIKSGKISHWSSIAIGVILVGILAMLILGAGKKKEEAETV